ncbi:transglycosylase domain-containing protein [Alkalicoccus saliphilus]|uniref:Penicillin-binding protein n=1 Tax=Alkalicoccus saliphilus TaxID=200989 RepID=A0A2T4U2W3_9BACI|nr:PBP1A family penicillin-binding protein [Alkalicoccus saliphilus]PTL37685.1 penicillin-binding protein [Alkalicoccus saliphilus]
MWIKRITVGIVLLLLLSIAGVTVYLGIILFGNYAIDEKDLVMKETTTVVDSSGEELTRLFSENRESVDLNEIPDHVQEAFIAVEDQRFYDHTGIDFRSIGRALYRDIITRSAAEGGSTITQQLAKNAFLSPEKSILRKTEEVLIALNLEHRYEKDEILEMYLNRIYFGHGAHGVQAASRLYFGKTVDELSIEEGAMLAALPKGPNLYSPFIDEERGKERRDLVLRLMNDQDYLSAEETVRLQGRTLPSERHSVSSNEAYDAYIDLLLLEMEEKHGLTEEEVLEGGYTIQAAMDEELQSQSYEKMSSDETYPVQAMEGSYVLLDNDSGGVLAVQGGRNYEKKGLNYASAKRQPGSTMKPIAVYAPALETGEYDPYTLLVDEELDYDGYSPGNMSGEYEGEISMYEAVKDSVNAPAVWLLNEIGVDESKAMLGKQNIALEEDGLSIALGGLDEGLTPLQMAAAYRTFANNGVYSDPYFVEKVYDRHGELISEAEPESEVVMTPQTAWYMTRMLEAVVTDGTGQAGTAPAPLAGKTGTTSEARDVWFAGWTPEVSGALWMGRGAEDDSGDISSALPTAVFKELLPASGSETAFEKPEGIEEMDEPVEMTAVDDLDADMKVGLFGANVELEWTGSGDSRIHYRIYMVEGDENSLIDEVVGQTNYTVSRANVFSGGEYVVVPYNPQTRQEGEPSNTASAEWNIFSRGS